MIEKILQDCQNPAILKKAQDEDLTFYELSLAESIRDDELAKEAAYGAWETAQTEYENRETACRDRAKTVVAILFTGFNRKSFQTIEAIFPGNDKLSEKFWKGKWGEIERAILADAGKAARAAGASETSVTKDDLKKAAERAAEIERDLTDARRTLEELTTALEEFDEDEIAVISELADEGYGTKDYNAKFWQKRYWSNNKKAKQIEARLEDKTVTELLVWWNAANADKGQKETEIEELQTAAVKWQQMAPFGQRVLTIGTNLVPEVESVLIDSLLLLEELTEDFRKNCAGDEMLRAELTRLIHQNKWAHEGRQDMETRAQKLRAQQDRVFSLHEALNAVRQEESNRKATVVAV